MTRLRNALALLLTAIAALQERGSKSRLLFISDYSNHTPIELVTYGRLLPKPFTPAQLLEAVRGALEDDPA